jgi:hypothetical protein
MNTVNQEDFMYQIVIATPLGELGTINMTKEVVADTLADLGQVNSKSFTLEDGQVAFMTKDMIGRSVFFVKPVS